MLFSSRSATALFVLALVAVVEVPTAQAVPINVKKAAFATVGAATAARMAYGHADPRSSSGVQVASSAAAVPTLSRQPITVDPMLSTENPDALMGKAAFVLDEEKKPVSHCSDVAKKLEAEGKGGCINHGPVQGLKFNDAFGPQFSERCPSYQWSSFVQSHYYSFNIFMNAAGKKCYDTRLGVPIQASGSSQTSGGHRSQPQPFIRFN